jgi:hypothetical protein
MIDDMADAAANIARFNVRSQPINYDRFLWNHHCGSCS